VSVLSEIALTADCRQPKSGREIVAARNNVYDIMKIAWVVGYIIRTRGRGKSSFLSFPPTCEKRVSTGRATVDETIVSTNIYSFFEGADGAARCFSYEDPRVFFLSFFFYLPCARTRSDSFRFADARMGTRGDVYVIE
jgi:hypothetical protein